MPEIHANSLAKSTGKLLFRAVLLDLQLSYDRALHLGYLWPGLSRVRLTDPDVLWRIDREAAVAVAERNIEALDWLIESQRRRSRHSDDYRISDHALALRARSAEELILHLARRHAPPASAAALARAG